MCLAWTYDKKLCPSRDELPAATQKLKDDWASILGFDLARITFPDKFTGRKRRRLLVSFCTSQPPPWGACRSLTVSIDERRAFTTFRNAVNESTSPLVVDHIDFLSKQQN